MRLTILNLLVLVLLCPLAWANTAKKSDPKTLANFTPGNYTLVSSDLDVCGEGEFELRENGENLGLGALHGFNLKPSFAKLPGDAPGDENCEYEGEDDLLIQGTETILTFSSIRRCDKIERYKLVKKAWVKKDRIKLEVTQTGEDGHNYTCEWTLKKSKYR